MGLMFCLHSVFASIQDASVDAIAISVVPEAERGRVNAFMRGGFLLGSSLGAAALATMLHRYDFFWAACTQSAALLVFTILTFFIRLDHDDQLLPRFGASAARAAQASTGTPSLGWLFGELWRAMRYDGNSSRCPAWWCRTQSDFALCSPKASVFRIA